MGGLSRSTSRWLFLACRRAALSWKPSDSPVPPGRLKPLYWPRKRRLGLLTLLAQKAKQWPWSRDCGTTALAIPTTSSSITQRVTDKEMLSDIPGILAASLGSCVNNSPFPGLSRGGSPTREASRAGPSVVMDSPTYARRCPRSGGSVGALLSKHRGLWPETSLATRGSTLTHHPPEPLSSEGRGQRKGQRSGGRSQQTEAGFAARWNPSRTRLREDLLQRVQNKRTWGSEWGEWFRLQSLLPPAPGERDSCRISPHTESA